MFSLLIKSGSKHTSSGDSQTTHIYKSLTTRMRPTQLHILPIKDHAITQHKVFCKTCNPQNVRGISFSVLVCKRKKAGRKSWTAKMENDWHAKSRLGFHKRWFVCVTRWQVITNPTHKYMRISLLLCVSTYLCKVSWWSSTCMWARHRDSNNKGKRWKELNSIDSHNQ